MNPATVRLELGIFSIPLSLCRFKWQARYREFVLPCFRRRLNRACSVLYFLINYTSKYDLTISGTVLMLALGKMVLLAGQRSLEKRGRAEKRAIREESSHNSGKSGWTGWLEPLSKSRENNEAVDDTKETYGALDELEDGSEVRKTDLMNEVSTTDHLPFSLSTTI